MILIKSSRLVYLFGILLIICIPLMNYFLGNAPKIEDEITNDFIKIVPLFILLELLLYFFFGLVSGGGSSIGYLIQYCFMLLVFRLLCCFLSAIIFTNYSENPSIDILLYFWMGNPLLVLIQVILMMMFGPHLAWLISPRAISDKALAFVGERRGILEQQVRQTAIQEMIAPVGGFIRVYNFEELGRLFLNMMGIEGYILYTSEGLILWKDCQLRFDMDKLVAVSLMEWNHHRAAQLKIGFNEPERLITQTTEHNFVHVAFNQSFMGIFIFKRNADIDDVLTRLQTLARSAGELLEMKYSPLI